MELPVHFADFLANIRPTGEQRADAVRSHTALRKLLGEDDDLDRYVIATFLQGSYRRSTDIKPAKQKKSDVDIIVVTNMDKQQFPDGAHALEQFRPFLEQHYPGSYEPQSHSWAIIDGEVELDLVPTSAPSEAIIHDFERIREVAAATEPGLDAFGEIRKAFSLREAAASGDEWKSDPLEIPDRHRQLWEKTHPLAQIEWTSGKNARCNGHYINVVRTLKWWWLHEAGKVHPKSYLLEAIVGETCPDGVSGVANGFVESLENILDRYGSDFRSDSVPFIADHGIRENNVLARLGTSDFRAFYTAVAAVAPDARQAFESNNRSESIGAWREILGGEFPDDDGGGNSGYEPPKSPAEPERRPRFAS